MFCQHFQLGDGSVFHKRLFVQYNGTKYCVVINKPDPDVSYIKHMLRTGFDFDKEIDIFTDQQCTQRLIDDDPITAEHIEQEILYAKEV